VVAAASSEEKLELARKHGADDIVLYERGPLDVARQKEFAAALIAKAQRTGEVSPTIGKISSLRASAGYHVILDGVGGTYTEPALRTLGWEGRYVSIGFAAGVPSRCCSRTPTSWASSRPRTSTVCPGATHGLYGCSSTGIAKESCDPL
jgi:NADPH2:quinone reductase